jgi:NADPH-dependent ferric siderophore reductase
MVCRVENLTPRMARVTFEGAELEGLTIEQPAASARLLLPTAPGRDLVLPRWNGNEFLLPDGRRPTIRTFTPMRHGPGSIDLEIVIHGGGAASEWVQTAQPGDRAAIAGPRRGYAIDLGAPGFLLGGDETAIPAISQLLRALPGGRSVQVCIEVADPAGRLTLPEYAGATVVWAELPAGGSPGDALVDAVRSADIGSGTRVWVAGEAAAVQRIRRHLFQDRGVPRAQTSVRGYWKHGQSGVADDDN